MKTAVTSSGRRTARPLSERLEKVLELEQLHAILLAADVIHEHGHTDKRAMLTAWTRMLRGHAARSWIAGGAG